MLKIYVVAASAALALAACGGQEAEAPQGSEVGAAMPDTSAPRAANEAMTAPDAGATGTVPADGSQPAVAPTPPVGTAGGAGDAANPANPGNAPAPPPPAQ